MEFLKRYTLPIVATVLLIHFVLSLVISSQESMTYDEKAHIPAAYSYVRYGDMRLNPEHPPLIKDFAGLFLLPLHLSFPLASKEWQEGYNEQWAVGDMFINCSRPELACNDADTILFFARLPITLIAVLLGIIIFLWTRELGGTLAGLFATVLYALDPNMIAHSHYVTTDIASSAFIFLAFYFFVRFLKDPTHRNTLLAGVFLGLAELTKFSAVLVFPVFTLFAILYALAKKRTAKDGVSSFGQTLRALFSDGLRFSLVIVICFATVWIGYFFNTLGMPAEKVVAHADLFLSQPNTPAHVTHDLIVRMTASPILLPFAEYFVGIAKVFSRVAAGNVHYFLGTVTDVASPWYFPVVFFFKETLPFLVLLILTTGYGLFRMAKRYSQERALGIVRFLSHSLESHLAQCLGVFFILFYSYLSITGNLNIGLRHLFPILPFLYMLVGKTLADFYNRHEHDAFTRQLIAIFIGILFFSVAAVPFLSYPSYLSYFNAAVGGHTVGYRYVTDSNYDWGQDLKHLKTFVDLHNQCQSSTAPVSTDCSLASYPRIDHIRVDYFGGSDPKYYLGETFIPWWGGRTPEAGWYAISTFFYQESLYKKLLPGEKNYHWLESIQPIGRAGDSFLIYYIRPEDIPAP